MIDLGLWRATIGRFNLTREASSKLRSAISKPVFFDQVSHGLSWLCIVFLVWTLYSVKDNVRCAVSSPFLTLDVLLSESYLVNTTSVTCAAITQLDPPSVTVTSALHLFLHAIGLLTVSVLSVTSIFAKRRVLLSGDIEQNPGPDTVIFDQNSEQETKMATALGDRFKKLEDSLQTKLDMILSQICNQSEMLKQQEETMRRQGELLKQQGDALRKFGIDYEQMKETVSGLCGEIRVVKDNVQKNERAMVAVAVEQDKVTETVANLEAEIDRLESFSRRNNVKFFGIPEASPGEKEDCAEAVTHVLQTYIPNGPWGPETIERAHRLGKFTPNKSNPRPVIAKFQSWRDAIHVMRDREARRDMEHDGIRAAQDMTRRQVERLKRVRAEGKIGYFVNGQLHIKDNQDNQRTDVDNNDDDRHDDHGRHRRQEGNRTLGRRGRGHPQQHSNTFRGPLTRSRSADPSSAFEQPISEPQNMSDVMENLTIGSDEGHPAVLNGSTTDRPRTRSVSARQVTMTESWGNKVNTSTMRTGNEASKVAASATVSEASKAAASASGKQ